MYTVLVVGVLIVIVILVLAVSTTSKAYSYKHTVDPIENNPNRMHEKYEEEKQENQ